MRVGVVRNGQLRSCPSELSEIADEHKKSALFSAKFIYGVSPCGGETLRQVLSVVNASVVRREPFHLAGTWFDLEAGRARPNRGETSSAYSELADLTVCPVGWRTVRHPRAPSETRWKRPRRTGGAVRPIRAESPSLADVPRAVPPTEEVSQYDPRPTPGW